MKGSRLALLFVLILVATWMQACVSSRIAIFHSAPDFVLTTIVCTCLLIGTYYGTMISVWGGFMTCVLAGYNYGSVLMSRLIVGVLSGSLQQHIIQDNLIVPPVIVFTATWISEGLYFLMAPNLHNLRWWAHMTLGQSIYNSILSIPIYFGLRALKYGEGAENSFNPYIETV